MRAIAVKTGRLCMLINLIKNSVPKIPLGRKATVYRGKFSGQVFC